MRENAILTSVSCFHRPWVALETRGVRKQCFFQQQHKNTIFFSSFVILRLPCLGWGGVGWGGVRGGSGRSHQPRESDKENQER